MISGLKRTKQKVSEFLDEIEISLRLNMTFHWFVENLMKENTENSSVQQLCDKLLSTCGECDNVCLNTTDQCMPFLM